MRIRLLIVAMYQESDQDPHEQGLQEHPELPQPVGLREQVPLSTQGPPGPTRSDDDPRGTLEPGPQQQVPGAFSPIDTPKKQLREQEPGATSTTSGPSTVATIRGHEAATAPRGEVTQNPRSESLKTTVRRLQMALEKATQVQAEQAEKSTALTMSMLDEGLSDVEVEAMSEAASKAQELMARATRQVTQLQEQLATAIGQLEESHKQWGHLQQTGYVTESEVRPTDPLAATGTGGGGAGPQATHSTAATGSVAAAATGSAGGITRWY